MKTVTNIVHLTFALIAFASLALTPAIRAVNPPPDGGYAGGNTAEGQDALLGLTTGGYNTAVGFFSLRSDAAAAFNTGLGAGTLLSNTGANNTATGAGALLSNIAGVSNTANGAFALFNNTSGTGNIALGANAGINLTAGANNIDIGNVGVAGESNTIRIGDAAIQEAIFLAGIGPMAPAAPNQAVLVDPATGQLGSADVSSFGVVITSPQNTAVGDQALVSNTGESNTAAGFQALFSNTDGSANTAVGPGALSSNIIASNNNAVDVFALFSNDSDGTGAAEFNNAHGRNALLNNVDGDENDAFGDDSMGSNTTGSQNTAMGDDSLDSNTTGSSNTAVGKEAGNSITTGSDNVCLGHNAGIGIVDGSGIIAIGSETAGQFANIGPACFIGAIDGEPTGDAGSTVPVLIDSNNNLGTFASSRRVKHDIKPMDKASDVILALKPVSFKYNYDKKGTTCFGLIAEEVAQVDPDLVVRDKNGEPWTVRYEQINAMLLNEFLKEHRTVQELKSSAAKQDATIARQQQQIEALTAGLQKMSAQLELSKAAPRSVLNSQ